MSDIKSVNHLIINGPFAEPDKHWGLTPTGDFKIVPGRRRAEYRVLQPGKERENQQGELPGIAQELALVNQLRGRVSRWRSQGWTGTTPITRHLLQHWSNPNRERRLFFAQLEAIETLIFLTETKEGQKLAKDIPIDGDIKRWCAKMATGTGKTVVMALLIVWQTINARLQQDNQKFGRNFLLITPGLTVKDRLSVLDPNDEGNYYILFNLVPPTYREIITSARVLVINWHKLNWQEDNEIRKRKGVDIRGALSDQAWIRQVFGRTLSYSEPIIVINDEAHHAWRISPDAQKGDFTKTETRSATIWLEGIDRIKRSVGLLNCYDFTATPFAPSGKKTQRGEKLFEWIVTDFGLNDAIESGLVKTPRIAVTDNTFHSNLLPEELSVLYHLYSEEDIRTNLSQLHNPEEPLPPMVASAYNLLAESWKKEYDAWKRQNSPVPPVMVSITNRSSTAARVNHHFTQNKWVIPELSNSESTLHIDSNILKKRENEEGLKGEDLAKAEGLREQVKTIGVIGEPGEQIRHVIAVDMLSEGWDAKTVTHIMGLRAFTSQLLCEQVIGRGLRRTSYDINLETGLFEPEYVRIFGVPFTLLLSEKEPSDTEHKPTLPPQWVRAVPEKVKYEVWWPDTLRIESSRNTFLTTDIATIPILRLDAGQVLEQADMGKTLEWMADPQPDETLRQTLENTRIQTLAFQASKHLYEIGNHPQEAIIVAQITNLMLQFLQSGKVMVVGNGLSKEIVIKANLGTIARHLQQHVMESEGEQNCIVYSDPHRPVRTTSQMPEWPTRRSPDKIDINPKKTHLNLGVYDSALEKRVAHRLGSHRNVVGWVKNDKEHLGFRVEYIHAGKLFPYYPDFLIRLKPDGSNAWSRENETILVVETKGSSTDKDASKKAYLERWVKAVSAEGRWGCWQTTDVIHENDIPILLERLDKGA